ncbi:glycosyltransferase family 39 protein [Methanobrevibacter curvatus]|uniref:Glycosyltransferase RgtA/B/C/D-like domain-containing protein n=1 Tax=Methanobrevibacter curvatus TaxID=49547 RepID=A0A166CU27_9EURY|nr:glycosyltransferase family 39 protein [Methanobrevibacter curvatus]KZX14866.1 hypothetical protein MBCUR_03550 [Methanobrevibacter curvatus]
MLKIKWTEKKLSLIFLTAFSIIISFLIIYINCSTNFNSWVDVYYYLAYSLKFAGFNGGYDSYLTPLSPLIPFLNSLVFRMGFIGEDSIFIITGLFYILGVISSYFLFKLRFNNLISTLGAILFACFYIILHETGNGGFDVPSICLCILAMYLIMGKMKNTKYFYLGFVFLALGFLAKFTSMLMILVVFIYFLSKEDIRENFKLYFKKVFFGMIAFVLTTLPYFIYLWYNKLPIAFLGYAEAMGLGLKGDLYNHYLYYIIRIPYIIYEPHLKLAKFLIILVLLGCVIAIYKFISNLKNKKEINEYDNDKSEKNVKNNDKNNNTKIDKIKINNTKINKTKNFKNKNYKIKNKFPIFLLVLSSVLIISSFLLTYVLAWKYTVFLFFIAIILFSYGLNKIQSKSKHINYNITMFAWFFIYLIFFTTRITKVDRYFIAFLPPVIFICIYFINIFSEELNSFKTWLLKSILFNKSKKLIKIKKAISSINFNKLVPLLIIILFLISPVTYFSIDKHDSTVDNVKDTVVWLKIHDPNYKEKVIISDRPFYSFYLNKNILFMYRKGDSKNMSDFLKNENATYYITFNSRHIDDYNLIKQFGKVCIFEFGG